MNAMIDKQLPWTREEFEAKLREKGKGYHIYHPIHVLMYEGKLTQAQMQAWVANRYYYQIAIPMKDAAILSNCPDREIRRGWIQRIFDHDGSGQIAEGGEGGIEAWIHLGAAVGLSREDVMSLKLVAPGTIFAVDVYINFAKQRSWQESVCSSLTELFAPEIHQKRLDNWPVYYPWIEQEGYNYFRKRLNEAKRDVQFTLEYILEEYEDKQEHLLKIVDFKLNILWCMLDAISIACKFTPF